MKRAISQALRITMLFRLIATGQDGQESFKQFAEGAADSNLKTLFYGLEQQRVQFVSELQNLVHVLCSNPEHSGSTADALHRGWVDLKTTVTRQF